VYVFALVNFYLVAEMWSFEFFSNIWQKIIRP